MTSSLADIELIGVRKEYGAVVAVDRVSLSIARGEFFSLLGPSGCGKTTLLRMIAGFIYPTSGDVRIRGEVVNTVPPYKRETNMVFQQLALFPHLKVFDNIAFGLTIKKLPKPEIRERVERVLEQVGLTGFESRRPHELSGGQQQRVAIARAVINEPAALLLDEPLGALDLKLRNQMQLELKAVQKRLRTTFIYVTHDQGEAMTMSDRIAVMSHGRVEQLGTPAEIYQRPATRFVAHFIGEANLFDGRVIEHQGGRCVVEAGSLRFEVIGDVSEGKRVSVSLRPEHVHLPANPSDANRACGVVESLIYLGPVLRYEIRIHPDLKILAQLPASHSGAASEGDTVEISWSHEDAVLLRDEER